jgi:hypothetical protein
MTLHTTEIVAGPPGTIVDTLMVMGASPDETFTYTVTGLHADLFNITSDGTLMTSTHIDVSSPTPFEIGVDAVGSLGTVVDQPFTIIVYPAPG